MRRRSILAIAALIASALLTACGGEDTSATNTSATNTSATDEATSNARSVTRSWRVTEGDPEAMVRVMRHRIDGLDIDDAEIRVDDDTITVVLPPGYDAELDVVGRTAALSFRPVLSIAPPAPPTNAAAATDLLPQLDPATGEVLAVYELGPAHLEGTAIESADASLEAQGSWTVSLVLAPGAEGIDGFNALAAECFERAPTCPTGQLAIVLDDELLSAPSINAASFERDQIQISGGFNEGGATALAAALSAGALPGALEPVDG